VIAIVGFNTAVTAYGGPERSFLSVVAMTLVITLLTGGALLALGAYRRGNLIRFMPYPGVGGVLAGMGWVPVKGGRDDVVRGGGGRAADQGWGVRRVGGRAPVARVRLAHRMVDAAAVAPGDRLRAAGVRRHADLQAPARDPDRDRGRVRDLRARPADQREL